MLELIKKIVKIEKNGEIKHYSNYYIKYGDVIVQIKPSFVDSQNYKMMDLMVQVLQNYKKGDK